MPGHRLWPVLAPFAESWEPATTPGRLWDTGSGYPAARFSADDDDALPGVVVTVAIARLAEALAVLDRVEEVGVLYRRVEVATSAGAALAYEWLGPTDGMAVLASGWPPPPIAGA